MAFLFKGEFSTYGSTSILLIFLIGSLLVAAHMTGCLVKLGKVRDSPHIVRVDDESVVVNRQKMPIARAVFSPLWQYLIDIADYHDDGRSIPKHFAKPMPNIQSVDALRKEGWHMKAFVP